MNPRIFVFIALASACSGLPPKPGPASTDAGSDAGLQSACAKACTQLAMLGCPEAETSDGGKPCLKLCEDAQASRKFDMKPDCIASSKSIEAVRTCGTVRCGDLR